MAQISNGRGHIAAGRDSDNTEIMASEELSVWNTGQGNSSTPYLQVQGRTVGKPDDKGVPIVCDPRYPSLGAHRVEGENLYWIIEPDNDKSLDQTDANFVARLQEQIVDTHKPAGHPQRKRTEVWNIGDRITSQTDGGVPDGKTVTGGNQSPAVAYPELRNGEIGKLYGRPQFDPQGTAP